MLASLPLRLVRRLGEVPSQDGGCADEREQQQHDDRDENAVRERLLACDLGRVIERETAGRCARPCPRADELPVRIVARARGRAGARARVRAWRPLAAPRLPGTSAAITGAGSAASASAAPAPGAVGSRGLSAAVAVASVRVTIRGADARRTRTLADGVARRRRWGDLRKAVDRQILRVERRVVALGDRMPREHNALVRRLEL